MESYRVIISRQDSFSREFEALTAELAVGRAKVLAREYLERLGAVGHPVHFEVQRSTANGWLTYLLFSGR